MHIRIRLGLSLLLLVACRPDGGGPIRPLPAALEIVATPAATAEAGTVAGTFTVKVTDQTGAALSGTVVTFAVSLGGARVVQSGARRPHEIRHARDSGDAA
jgi:hypothetical protein